MIVNRGVSSRHEFLKVTFLEKELSSRAAGDLATGAPCVQRRGDLDFGLEISTARQEIGHRNDAWTTLRIPWALTSNTGRKMQSSAALQCQNFLRGYGHRFDT